MQFHLFNKSLGYDFFHQASLTKSSKSARQLRLEKFLHPPHIFLCFMFEMTGDDCVEDNTTAPQLLLSGGVLLLLRENSEFVDLTVMPLDG